MENRSLLTSPSDNDENKRRRGKSEPQPQRKPLTTTTLGSSRRSQQQAQHVEEEIVTGKFLEENVTPPSPPSSPPPSDIEAAYASSSSATSGRVTIRQRPSGTADMIKKPRNEVDGDAEVAGEENATFKEEEETEYIPMEMYPSYGTSFPAVPGSETETGEEKEDGETCINAIVDSVSTRPVVKGKTIAFVEDHNDETYRDSKVGTEPVGYLTPLRGGHSSSVINGDSSTSASPMGAHVHRILEALAGFPHPEESGHRARDGVEREGEANMTSTIGGRPGLVTNGSRSISGGGSSSSEASQSMKLRKKKARTEMLSLIDRPNDLGQGHAEMLNISAIISQVDRKNMDNELAQLVKELDDDEGGKNGEDDAAYPIPGLKLRRRGGRNGRRRVRKGRPSDVTRSKPSSFTSSSQRKKKNIVAFQRCDAAVSDGTSVTTEEDNDIDDALRTPGGSFLNFFQGKDWVSGDVFGSGDSVVEDSTTCVSGEAEDEPRNRLGHLKDPKTDSSTFQLLREVWESVTCNPFCDKVPQAEPRSAPAMKENTAVTVNGVMEQAKEGHTDEGIQFLEFIDASFFEELWKAAESIDLLRWDPFVRFMSHKDRSLSDLPSTCSLASTIPTVDESLDPCENPLADKLQSTSEVIDHSAILAKCLARGGDAGNSPIAKKKAELLLKQCEKKFPSLHARIIARLESKAGVKSLVRSKTLPDGTARPSQVDLDEEDDSLFSMSRAHTPTNPELENKTPRVRNFKRENSEPDAAFDESEDLSGSDALLPIEGNGQQTEAVTMPTVETDGTQNHPENKERAIVTLHSEDGEPSAVKFGIFPITSVPRLTVNSSTDPNDGLDNELDYSPTNEGPSYDLATAYTDASDSPAMPDYALLNSYFIAFDNELEPRLAEPKDQSTEEDPALFEVQAMANSVVSPLTIDSRASRHDLDSRESAPPEEGIEITDILADLTTTPTMVLHSPFEKWEEKKLSILSSSSTGANRPDFARFGLVPHEFYSGSIIDSADDPGEEKHPVVLKHRVLHKKNEFRSINRIHEVLPSGFKSHRLDDYFDSAATPIRPSGFDMRSITREAYDRRSPTSFPSLFSKEMLLGSSSKGVLANGDASMLMGCSDDDSPEASTTIHGFTEELTSPVDALRHVATSKNTWTILETSPRGRDETKESLLSTVEAEEPDSNSSWVLFPTPPRGTFRPDTEEQVPILASSHPGAILPLKGTKPKVRRKESLTRTGVGSPRESSMRMLRKDRAPTRFRRLVSTN